MYSVAGSEGTYYSRSESPYMMLLRIDGKSYAITQLETKKGLTRRAIDQLGVVKDINSLVVLSRA